MECKLRTEAALFFLQYCIVEDGKVCTSYISHIAKRPAGLLWSHLKSPISQSARKRTSVYALNQSMYYYT